MLEKVGHGQRAPFPLELVVKIMGNKEQAKIGYRKAYRITKRRRREGAEHRQEGRQRQAESCNEVDR